MQKWAKYDTIFEKESKGDSRLQRAWEKINYGDADRRLLIFHKYARYFIFGALLIAEIFLVAYNWDADGADCFAGFPAWYVVLPVAILLAAENAVKLFAVDRFNTRIAFYVLDVLSLLVLTMFTDGNLISTLYVIILTEFYLSQQKFSGSIAMVLSCIVLFFATFTLSEFVREGSLGNFMSLVTEMLGDFILILIHFLVINFAIVFYRKNGELIKKNAELNESNEKLQRAYRELQEMTALEERQRIAKDIHDTAGHSITTVIMQTEAAKLVVDTDPEDAKRKIAAANLQAKHALEELRESVHLLSGMQAGQTLKDMLLAIIHDSTDGTGIVIRYDIDDVKLWEAKERFVCNTLKEGISNGLRHGGATAFYFELKARENSVNFLLTDNGSGLETSELKEGFGLTSMHRRAESFGGRVWFETEPGEGFEIHLILPQSGEQGEDHD